ncbi:hypothetical protein FOMPIDRAFT_1029278 [Fomitopsis schrenkii]|uniref:Endonuclease/exonuclease/phosphatase domain-containing protein n=1 Tax=Fomitopsis schrenkii TaxID=2126942 RepID=S8ECQ2_FOMSC|nr:hypothetical protein FOMPIDRAFT_1029278 [Fomitopsis schrenkii]
MEHVKPAAQGVAFVLNREIVDTADIVSHELIPGRAMYLKMRWHGDSFLTAMNVYTPNSELGRRRLQKPSVVLGDFNIVEEAIDRLPPREGDPNQVEALRNLTRSLKVVDGWRITEPTSVGYSYPTRGSDTRSRIDRIYVSEELLVHSTGWTIETTGIPTDHKMVSAELSTARAPYIGKGRWAIPHVLLTDKIFMEEVVRLGEKAVKAAKYAATGEARTVTNNPQIILRDFKATVRSKAQARMKQKVPKLTAEIKKLNVRLAEIQQSPAFATNQDALEGD